MEPTNRFCTECGNQITAQSRFCNTCGAAVAPLPAGNQAAPPPYQQPGLGQQQAGYPAPPVPPAPPYQQPGTGQQPVGYPQQPGVSQPPAGYQQPAGNAPQSTYPANYGGGNYQPGGAGPLGSAPKSARGGCFKFFIILVFVIAIIGGAGGALVYFDSTGAITMPWSDEPDPKLYVGRWQAVSISRGGATVDMAKEKGKVNFEIVQGANAGLTGKLTNTAAPKNIVTIELKPVKNSKKYEGTAKDSADPKDIIKVSGEYAAATKELVLTAFPPNEPTSVFRLKKQ